MAKRRGQRIRKVRRRGVPLTVYLSVELSKALATVSSRRKVDKSTLVRTAIERLLADLESGQLDLPLGIGI
jgi:predicted DNA-binding protein